MNIRPLYDRIVVKRIEEQETTRHGIVIPDSARKAQEGEVMPSGRASGSTTAKWWPSTSKPATASCSANTPATKIKLDGTEYIHARG